LALYALADQFALHELAQICAAQLMETINKDNVVDRAVAADCYGLVALKQACLCFLGRRPEDAFNTLLALVKASP